MVSGEVLMYERSTGYCPFSLNKKNNPGGSGMADSDKEKNLVGGHGDTMEQLNRMGIFGRSYKRKNYKTQYTP
jgi:hypothetical protein